MKSTFLLLAFTLFAVTSHAQNILKFSDLQGTTKPKGDFDTYVSKDSVVYKIGDEIKIGTPEKGNTYTYITVSDLMIQKPISTEYSGATYKISSFEVKKGTICKWYVSIKTNTFYRSSDYPQRLSISVDYAVPVGELVSSSFMTSDAALAQLKVYKDKRDLELITQEEYDKHKAELVKFIK